MRHNNPVLPFCSLRNGRFITWGLAENRRTRLKNVPRSLLRAPLLWQKMRNLFIVQLLGTPPVWLGCSVVEAEVTCRPGLSSSSGAAGITPKAWACCCPVPPAFCFQLQWWQHARFKAMVKTLCCASELERLWPPTAAYVSALSPALALSLWQRSRMPNP